MKQQDLHTTWLVAGGGMVGAAMALGLARQGHEVTVLEPSPVTEFSLKQPYDLRISAITADNIELLQQLGVWDHLRSLRLQPFHQLAVREQGMEWLELGQLQSQQPLGYMIENQVLQFVLWQALQAEPGVTCVEGGIEKLDVANRQAISSHGQLLHYKWLLGCDGAQSKVRKASGIGVAGRSYGQSCLLSIVKTAEQVSARTWESFAGDEIHALLPLSDNQACFILYADTPRVKSWQASEEHVKRALEQRFASYGDFTVLQHGSFPLTRQTALHYVKEDTVLLGDAAHSIHPMAGQGVNLGFRDVKSLLKEIKGISAVHRSDMEAAFTRYSRLRRADNELMAQAMDAIGWSFKADKKPLQLLRRTLLNGLRHFKPGRDLMTAYASGVWKIT